MLMKIRRRSDGKFSTGGGNPRWAKGGKSWNRMQDLASHYDLVINGWGRRNRGTNPYIDTDVVCFAVDESQTTPTRQLLDEELVGREERAKQRVLDQSFAQAPYKLAAAGLERARLDERITQLEKEIRSQSMLCGIELKGFPLT